MSRHSKSEITNADHVLGYMGLRLGTGKCRTSDFIRPVE